MDEVTVILNSDKKNAKDAQKAFEEFIFDFEKGAMLFITRAEWVQLPTETTAYARGAANAQVVLYRKHVKNLFSNWSAVEKEFSETSDLKLRKIVDENG